MGINVNYNFKSENEFVFRLPNVVQSRAIKSYTPLDLKLLELKNRALRFFGKPVTEEAVKLNISGKEIFLNKSDLEKWLANYEGDEKEARGSIEERITKVFQDFKFYVPSKYAGYEEEEKKRVAITEPLEELLLSHLTEEERIESRLKNEFDDVTLETEYKRKVADGYILNPPDSIKKKLE